LSRFDFTLKHVAESKMEKVDRLSRRSDWKVGVENDNDNCYKSRLKGLSQETTLVLSGTRELDRVPNTK